jgi:hypothetical protein
VILILDSKRAKPEVIKKTKEIIPTTTRYLSFPDKIKKMNELAQNVRSSNNTMPIDINPVCKRDST